uniref:ARAD1D31944p n=1 Tax=Blastobotrys adeninivorans TaxID=409370 RepID=A0A060TB46_BLAAD
MASSPYPQPQPQQSSRSVLRVLSGPSKPPHQQSGSRSRSRSRSNSHSTTTNTTRSLRSVASLPSLRLRIPFAKHTPPPPVPALPAEPSSAESAKGQRSSMSTRSASEPLLEAILTSNGHGTSNGGSAGDHGRLASPSHPSNPDSPVEVSVTPPTANGTTSLDSPNRTFSSNPYATLVNRPDDDSTAHTSAAGSATAMVDHQTHHEHESERHHNGQDPYPYAIRLTPFIDHSSTMPAFYIGAVERKCSAGALIKVGRYTDKRDDSAIQPPELAPIVFKSKVVSRSHAEFTVDDEGKWFVRDVKSSSGTFLNHIRLAPACHESEPTPISDGDVLQLGMDYRGGSEEIYKCVKIRIELNYSWKKKANQFNMKALSDLRDVFAAQSHDLQECAICLLPVSPLQALFIAPCSHAWHYKCIRPLIIKPYPHFSCPNCRAVCDLEADIEVPDLSHLKLENGTTRNGE